MMGRMFMGRNGLDQLNKTVLFFGLICWVASMFAPLHGIQQIFYFAFVLLAGVFIYRALSRNIPQRQKENKWFLRKTGRIRSVRESRQAKAEQRRQYKVFRCPSCNMKLRVPRGKGRIRVTCRQCGATFEKES